MCPTPLGRIHTRCATIVGPALFGLIMWLATDRPDWLVLIGVYLLLGVALDACVYSWLLRYQPPWVTIVLGVAEFALMYVVANVLSLDLSHFEAIWFFWACWVLAAWTRIAVLPLISLTYYESSFEFRRPEWSLPPQQVPFPVVAAVTEGPGPVVRAASSGEHRVPPERRPSPSEVHAVPDLGAADDAPDRMPSGLRQVVPREAVYGELPSFVAAHVPSPVLGFSAARRFEATIYCYLVILAAAAGVTLFFADR
jgi:hypothetical protein